MLLLDRLLHADAETATAQLTVAPDALFLQDAGMPAWVGIEYMAQTVPPGPAGKPYRHSSPSKSVFYWVHASTKPIAIILWPVRYCM